MNDMHFEIVGIVYNYTNKTETDIGTTPTALQKSIANYMPMILLNYSLSQMIVLQRIWITYIKWNYTNV